MRRGHTCSGSSSPRSVPVLGSFPTRLRPAVVLPDAGRGDWLLCQITSNPYGDPLAIPLDDDAFASGSLRITSYARPGKLFTASDSCREIIAAITEAKLVALTDGVIAMLRAGR